MLEFESLLLSTQSVISLRLKRLMARGSVFVGGSCHELGGLSENLRFCLSEGNSFVWQHRSNHFFRKAREYVGKKI